MWRFSRGEDGVLVAAIVAIWVAALLSLGCAALTVGELRGSGGVSLARRVARALPAVAFRALTWYAWNWGLRSNPTRY